MIAFARRMAAMASWYRCVQALNFLAALRLEAMLTGVSFGSVFAILVLFGAAETLLAAGLRAFLPLGQFLPR